MCFHGYRGMWFAVASFGSDATSYHGDWGLWPGVGCLSYGYCGNSVTGLFCLRVSMRDRTPLFTLVETRRDTESPGGEEPQAFWEMGRATKHFWYRSWENEREKYFSCLKYDSVASFSHNRGDRSALQGKNAEAPKCEWLFEGCRALINSDRPTSDWTTDDSSLCEVVWAKLRFYGNEQNRFNSPDCIHCHDKGDSE